MGGGGSSPPPPPAPSCAPVLVCDNFDAPFLANGSSCTDNAWTDDWILIGNASLPGGEVCLQEHRFHSQAARYVDVSYSLPVVTTLSFAYATTNIESGDHSAVGISADNGSSWTILKEYVNLPDSAGVTIATESFDVSAWQDAPFLLGFNVTQEYQEPDEYFHVRNVTLTTACTPAPTPSPTPAPTSEPTPEPTPEPSPSPTSEPTPEPSPSPTSEPTPEPTREPTPEPSAEPSAEPSSEPTGAPSLEPTGAPTPEPTPVPPDSVPASSAAYARSLCTVLHACGDARSSVCRNATASAYDECASLRCCAYAIVT